MFQPPPPPPPPPLFHAPTLLPSRQRAPAHSNGNRNLSKIQTTGRNAALGLHPETLQHAAAGLRKTIHGQQILSCEGHEPSGRPDQLPSPGNWENFEGNDKLQQSPPRKPILATGSSSHFNSPISVRDLHAYPLTMQPKHYYEEVFYSPPNNNNNNNGPNLTSADIQSIYDSSSSYKNNNVSPPPNSFYHQSPTPLRQPILTTTSNYGKSQHNDSIPIPIKINNSSHLIQSTPLNTNNNTHSEHSNRYEAYALNNNPAKQDNIFGVNGVVKHQAKTEYFRQDNSPLQSGYIKDPKHYIHQFATKTPIGSLFHNETQRPDGSSSHQFASSSSPTTVNKRGQRERSFAEELRDSSLTERQKYSNKFQKTLLQDNPLPRSFNNFHQTNFLNRGSDELNDLIRDMQIQMSTNTKNTTKTFTTMGESEISSSTMRNHHGPADHPIDSSLKKIPRTDYNCFKCKQIIQPDRPGVTALGNSYHVECFVCEGCGKQLAGSSFYNVSGKCYCENSLEKCIKCHLPIKQKILRALDGAFHPDCFVCHNCDKSLDGVGFTTNKEGEPHCMICYHERYSPRCATCLKPIAPAINETEVPRIIAMEKSYHVECYRCEDCGLQLNSKIEGQGCYPIEARLFCKGCNQKRLS